MPEDNITRNILVPNRLVTVIPILSSKCIFGFSYYIIANLALSFQPTGYSNLKPKTY
jgi:hypothetical protein